LDRKPYFNNAGDKEMLKTIKAVYENGLFHPLESISLPDRTEVKLVFLSPEDDLSSLALAKLAEESPSFAFLADPREDIYTLEDGEPVR
jgi:predicted DNA-binding antitoxin AbrB/MazE fold protein